MTNWKQNRRKRELSYLKNGENITNLELKNLENLSIQTISEVSSEDNNNAKKPVVRFSTKRNRKSYIERRVIRSIDATTPKQTQISKF